MADLLPFLESESAILSAGQLFNGRCPIKFDGALTLLAMLFQVKIFALMQKLKCFPISRFIRFGVVGFSGLFVDIAVTTILLEGIGLPAFFSSALAIETAIVNNFLWNDAWTFADVAQQQHGWKARFQRFYQFNSVCLIGAALQLGITKGVLWVPFVDRLPEFAGQLAAGDWTGNTDFYFAKLVAIVVVTFWNFWANLNLSWRRQKEKR